MSAFALCVAWKNTNNSVSRTQVVPVVRKTRARNIFYLLTFFKVNKNKRKQGYNSLQEVFRFHMKSAGFHEIRRISCGFHVKSGRFHEIPGHSPHLAFIKLKSFCWNTCFYNFGWISQVKSTRFHGWNPPYFRVKSTRFLGWNPPPCIHQTQEFLLKHLLL